MPEEYLVSDPHLLPLEAQWRAYLGGSFSDGYLGPPDRMSLSVPVITPDREWLWLVVSRCSGAPLLSGWLFCNGSDWKEEDVCPISAPGRSRLFSHYCGTCCTYRDAPYPHPHPPPPKKSSAVHRNLQSSLGASVRVQQYQPSDKAINQTVQTVYMYFKKLSLTCVKFWGNFAILSYTAMSFLEGRGFVLVTLTNEPCL